MINKISIIFSFIVLIAFAGCNDFLDPNPRDRLSDKMFWENKESTDLYLNSFYVYLTSYGNFGNSQFHDGLLTEGMTSMLKYGASGVGAGNANQIMFNPYFVTADQTQGLVIWNTSYERIRRINEFLQSLRSFSIYDEDTNKGYEAQARFIRAFLYYQLLLRTHTVILYDKLPDGNDKPLSSEDECWDFVESDLDYAIVNLPVTWPANYKGRITKGAAYAMKSRAMLVAKRWEKSYNAAKEVINIQGDDGELYKLNSSYKEAFKSYFEGNKEAILEFRYKLPSPHHSFDREFAPGGDWTDHGGDATPTQEMVEEYELATGGKPDWSQWHQEKTTQTPPYNMLEPRFQASVLYNGAQWKGRQIESFVGGKDGYIDYGQQTLTYGKTTTGYYLRKYLKEGISDISTTYSDQPWIEIRLAEVYLNLAEACANLGKEDEANSAIRKIRDRVNLPYADKSGGELMKAIKHERKVELAFEGFHYWDLRRWGDAKKELDNERFHGLKITKDGTTFTYEYVDVDKQDRHFPDRFYNFPIPTSEISNNRSLSQISGW